MILIQKVNTLPCIVAMYDICAQQYNEHAQYIINATITVYINVYLW